MKLSMRCLIQDLEYLDSSERESEQSIQSTLQEIFYCALTGDSLSEEAAEVAEYLHDRIAERTR